MILENVVQLQLIREPVTYPSEKPYHPQENYPEYLFPGKLSKSNSVYEGVRNIFYHMDFDSARYGTKYWNPLGWLIRPGDIVTIKPNWVSHPKEGVNIDCLLTHGSLIRAIIDFVYIALKGKGQVIIADAPIQTADWNLICMILGIYEIVEFYKKNGFDLSIVDLRRDISFIDKLGLPCKITRVYGDPLGYCEVQLGRESMLDKYERPQSFRVAQYNNDEMSKCHSKGYHKYVVSRTVLNSDVIINLPKLKTHKRAGFTGAMKNLVGITGTKNCLPHHRKGALLNGGDEYLYRSIRKNLISAIEDKLFKFNSIYPRLFLLIMKNILYWSRKLVPFKDGYLFGSWYGNETIGGMISDINKIILYCDKYGILQNKKKRRIFNIVDAIVAGEGEGPLNPKPKRIGLIIGGLNPVAVDLAGCCIIGYETKKIPALRAAFETRNTGYNLIDFDEDDVFVKINENHPEKLLEASRKLNFKFIPPSSWTSALNKDI